jgi:hypothetical protein
VGPIQLYSFLKAVHPAAFFEEIAICLPLTKSLSPAAGWCVHGESPKAQQINQRIYS